MEYVEEQIKDVVMTPEEIRITYMNDMTEVIEKSKIGYKLMYDGWLVEQPMFISDIYKMQMRDLFFASRGNTVNIENLNKFFSNENKSEVTKFLIYMRGRDLTFERDKWNKQRQLLQTQEINENN